MVINTNIAALTSADNLNNSTNMLNQSLARLSSGSQLVNASDNPAGLAESISLTAQINQVGAANDAVSNANSFSQTQDGYLQQVGSALQQMAQLSVQAQDGTQSTTNLADDQKEFNALATFINQAATQTFNGVSLFSSASMTVVTNGTGGTGGTFSMTGVNLGASVYSGLSSNNISTTTGAGTALAAVTAAITQLGTDRATVGANELRLNYTGQELQVLQTNLSAANSTIADVNVATESTAYAKYQILVQSGTSMLAQANQDPQLALKLLGA
jgi:flagellin